MIGRFAVGLVLLGCSTHDSTELSEEIVRREEYARALSADAGASSAWHVASTSEIHYVSGFSLVSHDPPDDFRNPAFRWMGQRGYVRLKTNGAQPMRLGIVGWAHEKVLRTRPIITAYIDGQVVGATDVPVPPDGHWSIEKTISPEVLRGRAWVDLVIVVSAVAFHWADPPDLRVVVLNKLTWENAAR